MKRACASHSAQSASVSISLPMPLPYYFESPLPIRKRRRSYTRVIICSHIDTKHKIVVNRYTYIELKKMFFGLQQNFNIIKYLLCKQTKYVSNYYKHIHTEYAIDTHLNCM